MIEEQKKIILQRRRQFLDDEFAHRDSDSVLFQYSFFLATPTSLTSLGRNRKRALLAKFGLAESIHQ